jgi:hypothetical protein
VGIQLGSQAQIQPIHVEYRLPSQPQGSDNKFRVDKAESGECSVGPPHSLRCLKHSFAGMPGGDDSDFGKDPNSKLSTRKPPSRRVETQRSLSPEYARLRPKTQTTKKMVKKEVAHEDEDVGETKESPDEILGNESMGFRQAKLAHMQYNLDFGVRSGGPTTQLESSGEESSEMEFKPRPVAVKKQEKAPQLRDIKASQRKRESVDRGLELREGEIEEFVCSARSVLSDVWFFYIRQIAGGRMRKRTSCSVSSTPTKNSI